MHPKLQFPEAPMQQARKVLEHQYPGKAKNNAIKMTVVYS